MKTNQCPLHSNRRKSTRRALAATALIFLLGLLISVPGNAQTNQGLFVYMPFVQRAQVPEWSYTIVDSSMLEISLGASRYLMTDHAIQVGLDNLPRIAYYDNGLYYATFNGQSWNVQVVDSATNAGKFPSLAIDTSGIPHISYYDDTSNHLRYARWNGSGWNRETVDSTSADTGQYSSIAIDSLGEPHIAYYDATNRQVKYIFHSSGTWNTPQIIELNPAGHYNSISAAIDSNNWGRVAFYDASYNENLKYAQWLGGDPDPRWFPATIDTSGNVGVYASLALDSNDNPRIAYMDDSNDNLKYIFLQNFTWNVSSIDTIGNVGFYASIAIDSNDRTHIAYYDATAGKQNLKYARFTGTGWEILSLDSAVATDAGYFAALALDQQDLPYIAYFDNTNNDLKCAHRNRLP